jgi:hypothetical protein
MEVILSLSALIIVPPHIHFFTKVPRNGFLLPFLHLKYPTVNPVGIWERLK